MITGLDYWYDRQQLRFLEQIVRAFSGFQYMTGRRNGEEPQLKMVPCRMASTDRMMGQIARNLSENTLLSVPLITVWQTGLRGRREDVQNTGHVDTRQVVERAVDPGTGLYTGERGNRYTVQRLMPRPFSMTVQIDLWTSNYDQKYQIMEQMLTVCYPDFDIQNSDNALDWSALTMAKVDEITWTSRSLPISAEEIEIATITLELPFWLSPPAMVKQQKVIEQIVTNIHSAGAVDEMVGRAPDARVITSPGNHRIRVENGVLTLLGARGAVTEEDDTIHPWQPLLEKYGTVRPTESRIRLIAPGADIEGEDGVVGSIQYDQNNPNRMYWQIDPDTLPRNTLAPVNAVIDPLRTWPDNGLPTGENGQRYLVLADIAPSLAWGALTAARNDIIEMRNGVWTVAFDASWSDDPQHVLNLNRMTQLRWQPSEQEWELSVDGVYGPGHWRVML